VFCFGCWMLGSYRPNARRLVWRNRSMTRRARTLSTRFRDATRRARCDVMTVRRARCDAMTNRRASCAIARHRYRGSSHIIICTVLVQKCTSLRIVSPTLFLCTFSYCSVSRIQASRAPVCDITRLERWTRTRAWIRWMALIRSTTEALASTRESRHTSTGDRGDDGDDRVGEM